MTLPTIIMTPKLRTHLLTLALFLACHAPGLGDPPTSTESEQHNWLKWDSLPDLPAPLGVAGPFVGVHNDALIVAGGANFPVQTGEDLWEVEKVWHDDAWVLVKDDKGYQWKSGFKLKRAAGYGMCVSTDLGVVCLGGNDGKQTFADSFLLRWDNTTQKLKELPFPNLPEPCAYGAATVVDNTIYVAGGQTGLPLESATSHFWRLKLPDSIEALRDAKWESLPAWPGPARAFNLTIMQHNGFDNCVYVIGGRRQDTGVQGISGIIAMGDVYEFNPKRYDASAYDVKSGIYTGQDEFANPWRKRSDAPKPTMAGTAITVGQSHIMVVGGADGLLLKRIEKEPEFVKSHPGFEKVAWSYHTITDRWVNAGAIPQNHVTTPAVRWGDHYVVATGEIKPRVRTKQVWAISTVPKQREFGAINFMVLTVYLALMLGVGFYFARKQKDTDDFFRGGKQIAWWAAACSIFATMLSSITFMAIPAKAYAQDLVYLVGNMMILAVAPIAIYLALPFFRRIDATSAYEYLEKRFNRPVRQIASALFSVFHLFRMAIVMSLAALALATITPMNATTCVLVIGVLSMAYCTMGGVEAVIWTDTIQTVVLLGGALLCLILLVTGIDGGIGGMVSSASASNKLHAFNLHLDPSSASIALWVIVIGAIGQNISSYTADQAVVQRYMTTPDQTRAARSIWLAACMAIPASFIFYGLGTALFAYYQSHPEQLDPTFTTDQIFPLFIVDQVPVGLAGLIVAGIFAAAQSTVSTSMNSTTTAVVTDFLQTRDNSRRSRLGVARALTVAFGVGGTLLGLLFIDPSIKSLFDQFLKVVGLFMGVLGGLFAMGVLTTRCSGTGALIGLVCGAGIMFALPFFSDINGYLYAAIGLSTSFVIGYIVSLLLPGANTDLSGLTIHSKSGSTA